MWTVLSLVFILALLGLHCGKWDPSSLTSDWMRTPCCYCFVAKLHPILCNPMDCYLPGSSVHGIFQARILKWVAISFSRVSSWPRDQTCISCITRRILYHWATRELTVNFRRLNVRNFIYLWLKWQIFLEKNHRYLSGPWVGIMVVPSLGGSSISTKTKVYLLICPRRKEESQQKLDLCDSRCLILAQGTHTCSHTHMDHPILTYYSIILDWCQKF